MTNKITSSHIPPSAPQFSNLTIPSVVEELHDECIGVTFKILDVLCLLLPTAAPRVVRLTTLLLASVVVVVVVVVLLL
jgi:hypothetical protein